MIYNVLFVCLYKSYNVHPIQLEIILTIIRVLDHNTCTMKKFHPVYESMLMMLISMITHQLSQHEFLSQMFSYNKNIASFFKIPQIWPQWHCPRLLIMNFTNKNMTYRPLKKILEEWGDCKQSFKSFLNMHFYLIL